MTSRFSDQIARPNILTRRAPIVLTRPALSLWGETILLPFLPRNLLLRHHLALMVLTCQGLTGVAAQGFERVDATALSANDLGHSEKASAAECAANRAISDEIEAGLQMVIDAWPSLSNEARDEVLEIVKAADRPA